MMSYLVRSVFLLAALCLFGCPGGDDGPDDVPDWGPDAGGWGVDVSFGVGDRVGGFREDGPMYGEDGCIYWDPLGAPRTTTSGGTLYDEEGNPVEIEPGAEILPLGMCFTHTIETDVIRQSSGPPLPRPAHPSCSEEDLTTCPNRAPGPGRAPGFREDAVIPFPPFAHDNPEPPGTTCTAGLGFSFESGTLDGWTALDEISKAPVFGNNVSVKRLRPPGFYPVGSTGFEDYVIEREIGGDYWEFSRDVNQQGNWWYGTGDDRDSHTLRPGTQRAERAAGHLVSQEFEVGADYIAFWMGGSSDVAQRVELQILADDEDDVGVLWDTYHGIGTVEFPPNFVALELRPDPNALWLVMRASSPLVDGEYMGRRVVWDVSEYMGKTARLRVVDEDRDPWFFCDPTVISHCAQRTKMAHINVDDFVCLDEPPEGMVLLDDTDVIGHVLKPQPIWGFTESHSHATANLAFGGHMIWGDWGDELYDVYNCLHDLPAIVDNTGEVLRSEIRDPRNTTTCFVRSEIVAAINSAIHGICVVASAILTAIPIFGPILAAAEISACTLVVNAVSAALLTTPIVRGHRYHGAQMPTSGAIELGPMFTFVQDFLVEIDAIKAREIDRIPGMIEEKDFDLPDGSHSGRGLGQFHNHYQKDMVRRAFLGGMRMMVIDVHNSRAMQGVLDGASDYDDWRATRDHVRAAERLVAGPGDARWPVGALNDIAAIAYTPQEARDIIASGRMAIILGVEVMELGKMRDATDSVQRQVDDLYALGIRKITAIHGTNNPLGGTALFQDIYQSANIFNNLTVDGQGQNVAEWDEIGPSIDMTLPAEFPFPFGGMSLGTWGIYRSMVAPPCGFDCDWKLRNKAHFVLTSRPDPRNEIEGVEDVTWRLGYPSLSPLGTYERSKYLQVNQAHSLGWLMGVVPGVLPGPPQPLPAGCSFEGMYIPFKGNAPDDVEEIYHSHTHHFNEMGITAQGRQFLNEMMKRGMMMDTDHFSQTARVDAFDVTRAFARNAGYGNQYDYAVLGVHTELRGFEFGGPYPDIRSLREKGGIETELSKTPKELERMSHAKGIITISVSGFMKDADYGKGVENNCDFSSKGYAHKYLKAMELMGGRGLTPGFDMNGFAPFIASRYGVGNACRSGITRDALKIGGYDFAPGEDDWEDKPPLANWPRDWIQNNDNCRYNGSLKDGWDPECQMCDRCRDSTGDKPSVPPAVYRRLRCEWRVPRR